MLLNTIRDVRRFDPVRYTGRIRAVEGLRLEATGPEALMRMGGVARLGGADGPRAEITGFRNDRAIMMACDPADQVRPGSEVIFEPDDGVIYPGDGWLGRMVGAFGEPVDGRGPLRNGERPRPVMQAPPAAHSRQRVTERLDLGVRVMDLFTPCGKGQRLGLFAGSGVGKSTLMSMLARDADADVIVIGLIGERGREIREFVEDALGEEGLARSVIVTATSDSPAPRRRRAAWTTLAVAEYFRDRGKSVLCLLDSVTRFAMAQREIGLASGEPPATRGYTPSVFAELPKLLERAGPGAEGGGTITGLFTVLVEGDDHNEPVADAVRGILDGHVVLSRQIAERGRFPAVDVLRSLSRLAPQMQSTEDAVLVREARQLMSIHADMEDLVRIGAYVTGSDPRVDRAIAVHDALESVLSQASGGDGEDDELDDIAALTKALESVPA